MFQKNHYLNVFLCGIACIAVLGVVSFASAETIEINITGMNISYTDTTDVVSATGDALTSAAVSAGGSLEGVLTSDLELDLSIPGVEDIPKDGGTVLSAAGGMLDLDLGSGNFLNLDLDEATVSYVKVVGGGGVPIFQGIFGGAVSAIDDQDLPFDLIIGQPVTVSFSTQVTSAADDGTYLTSFTAAGTGEITGNLVPEPSSLAIVLMAIAGLMAYRRN